MPATDLRQARSNQTTGKCSNHTSLCAAHRAEHALFSREMLPSLALVVFGFVLIPACLFEWGVVNIACPQQECVNGTLPAVAGIPCGTCGGAELYRGAGSSLSLAMF